MTSVLRSTAVLGLALALTAGPAHAAERREAWRDAARGLIADSVPPDQVVW